MSSTSKWTIEKVKQGFEDFFKANGHYPSALEIDRFNMLPSSRQIQRRWGGLKELKRLIGLPDDVIDLSRGQSRSDVARKIGARGKDFEKLVYRSLVDKFGEVFVHAQSPFNDYSNRMDFLVFSKSYKFGVDVFYPDNFHNLVGCVNIKLKSYVGLDFDIILLSVNELIDQGLIDKYLNNRKISLPKNIKVYTLSQFKTFVSKLEVLTFS